MCPCVTRTCKKLCTRTRHCIPKGYYNASKLICTIQQFASSCQNDRNIIAIFRFFFSADIKKPSRPFNSYVCNLFKYKNCTKSYIHIWPSDSLNKIIFQDSTHSCKGTLLINFNFNFRSLLFHNYIENDRGNVDSDHIFEWILSKCNENDTSKTS